MAILRLLLALALVCTTGLGCSMMAKAGDHRMNQGDIIRVNAGNVGPAPAQRWTRQGVAAVQKGDIVAAEASFKTAIRSDESYGPAHNNLGRVYFEQGKLQRAAEAFRWALEFMPDRPEPANNLGLIQESIGELDEAIAFYQQAHQLQPGNSEYLGNLLRARVRRGDRGENLTSAFRQLKLAEARPEWKAWANEKLVSLGTDQPANSSPLLSPASGSPASGDSFGSDSFGAASFGNRSFDNVPNNPASDRSTFGLSGPDLLAPSNEPLPPSLFEPVGEAP